MVLSMLHCRTQQSDCGEILLCFNDQEIVSFMTNGSALIFKAKTSQ